MPQLADERPTTAEGLAEALLDRDVLAKHFGTREDATRYLGEVLAKQEAEHDKETTAKFSQEMAATVAEMMASNGFRKVDDPERPATSAAAATAEVPPAGMTRSKLAGFALNSESAPGAKLNATYRDLGRSPGKLVHAMFPSGGNPSKELAAAHNEIRRVSAAYSSTVGSSGGFLIPEELRSEFLRMELEESIMLPRVTTLPMGSKTLSIPSNDVTSHASSLFGGVIVYWRAEGAALTESQAAMAMTKLEANSVYGLARIPNEMIADTDHFDAYFNAVFPPAMSYEKDYQMLVGTGVGRPRGYLNAPGRVTVAKETGQVAATVVYENVVKMWTRLLPAAKRNAIWVVSPDVEAELMTMAMSVGTGGSAIWLANAAGSPPVSIFGRPVFVSEKVPVLGTEGDISVFDPRYYLHGDRQANTIAVTDQEQWANEMTSFKVTARLDGREWFKSALTPKNGGSTLSPIVTLATRA